MRELTKQRYVPQLLLIGATGRNSGKTTVATALIQKFKTHYPIIGVKIITIKGARGQCQRGGVGCGICTSIDGGYALDEEKQTFGTKDTMQMLAAGCQKTFLLRTFTDDLITGFQAILTQIPQNSLLICESNTLRTQLKPGLFLMLDRHEQHPKATAQQVYDRADLILERADSPELQNISIRQNATLAQKEWVKLVG